MPKILTAAPICASCVQTAIVILGAVVTYSTDIADCTKGLYHFTSITIGMGLASMGLVFLSIANWKLTELKVRIMSLRVPILQIRTTLNTQRN